MQGFSVVQEASLMVQSFPHAPDVFALLKELAVRTGEAALPEPSSKATAEPPQTSLPSVSSAPQVMIAILQKMTSSMAKFKK